MRRALFLDRDGTLIVDVGYPRDPDAVEVSRRVLEALHDELVAIRDFLRGRGR